MSALACMHAHVHRRCVYMCVCACRFAWTSSKTEYLVLSIDWKSPFDGSFLMSWAVPTMFIAAVRQPLEWLLWDTGDLSMQLAAPWSGSAGLASVQEHLKQILQGRALCWEASCNKPFCFFCFCLSSWWRSTCIPFCLKDFPLAFALCEGRPHPRPPHWRTHRATEQESWGCWGGIWSVEMRTVAVHVNDRQREVWKPDVFLERCSLVSFEKVCPSCRS